MKVRCPHCQNHIEVVDEQDLSSILCTSCGSSFSIVGDVTETESFRSEERQVAHFQLHRPLGSGAFGTVWQALDTRLDRQVAIKLPRRTLDAQDTEKFLREARAAAQFNHPNIVSVHEVGRDQQQAYIVSDYVDGVTLADRLTLGPFSVNEAATICAKIADALHHAHQAGVIHRDLKPSNILLVNGSEPLVTDFGLAKRETGEITMTIDGQVLGTPAYMSPEQARGEAHDADRRSDVYSLGVIFFEMLTGERPFRGNRRMLLHQVINDEPLDARQLNNSVPRDLETVCQKCLQKDPKLRYQNASDLGDDLRRHLDGKPVLARPLGQVSRCWRWCRRHPAVASSIAAICCLFIVATAAALLIQAARAETERLRWNAENRLYSMQISSAERAWREGDIGLAMENLNACLPTLRGWEHDYLYTAFNRNQQAFKGFDGPVQFASLGTESDRFLALVSAGQAKSQLLLCSAISGDVVRSFDNQVERIKCASTDPDGERIAIGGGSGEIVICDIDSGIKLRSMVGSNQAVRCLDFSHDGTLVAGGYADGTVRIWEPESGREPMLLRGHSSFVGSLDFYPDGKRIVTAGPTGDRDGYQADGPGDVFVWDVTTGRRIRQLKGHPFMVTSVAVSPNGKRIVAACGFGQSPLTVWNAETGKVTMRLFGHTSFVKSATFDADGDRIVSVGGDRIVRIWDAATGLNLERLKGHADFINSVRFSSDGGRVITASDDASVRIWRTDRERREDFSVSDMPILKFFHVAGVRPGSQCYWESLAFSNNRQLAVTGSGLGSIRVWDVDTGDELFQREHVARSEIEEKTTAPSGNKITVWNVTNVHVAVSHDDTRIATGCTDNLVKLWGFPDGALVKTLRGHRMPVRGLAFSPDGNRLASVAGFVSPGPPEHKLEPGELIIWDLATDRPSFTLSPHADSITSIAYHPSGLQVACASEDKTATIIDVGSGRVLRTLNGHGHPINCIDFSPDGRRVVTAGGSFSEPGEMIIWDTDSGIHLLTLRGHESPIKAVFFSHDGRKVFTADQGNTIKVWDASKTTPLQ